MTSSTCDLAALKEKTDKIVVAKYNEYYLRDDLFAFKKQLINIRDTSDISTEIKSELDQLISRVSKRYEDICECISMDPSGGMGNSYFDDWD